MRVLLTVLHCLLLPAKGADWPNWRGPKYDGISTEKLPSDLPKSLPVAWNTEVGTGFCTVSVQGERVVTMGNIQEKDTIWCLNVTNGRVLWRHVYDCPLDPLYYEGGPGSTPTIFNGAVYSLSKKGHVFCLDLQTGKVVWERDLVKDHDFKLPEWNFAGSPFIYQDSIILSVGRQAVALSLKDGVTQWMPSKETAGYATMVPFKGDEHLYLSAKSLMGISLKNGASEWAYPWKTSRDVNAADPVSLGNNRLIVSSSIGTSLLDLSSGKPIEQWKQRNLRWYFNPGVVIGKHIYSIHGTTHRPTELVCTELKTGKMVWSQEGYGSGGLVAAGNDVIVFDKGTLTIFEASPEEFKLRLRQTVMKGKCWTSPVLADQRIYCRNATGTLICLSLRAVKPD
ncbi:MAG: PQQ-binding-like beta-propeller repeat protein [Limisphaerales bacterium]